MKKVIVRLGLIFVGILLRFRYKVTYKGLEAVKEAFKNSPEGILFLPNHPAVIVDPLIVSLPLIRHFGARPLIIEYMYYQRFFHGVVRMINALPIPNFSTGFSPLKLKRAERRLQEISQGLKKGDSFLIYPSGTTKHQAREVMGGAFGVHQLVSENPGIPVVLVRQTGLWGSSFSRALTNGETPHTKEALKRGFWCCLKNLFFVPKRRVLLEFELAENLPRTAPKLEFNRYLENWYNKPFGAEGEPLSLVSYAFWKKELAKVQEVKVEKFDLSKVTQETKNKVVKRVAELAKVPASQILPDLKLIENLGLDSLDQAELISFLEDEFDVSGALPQDLTTVGQLFVLASGGFRKRELAESPFNMKGWNKKKEHTRVSMPEGRTLIEVLLRACDGHLFDVICADPMMGPMTYYSFKRSVIILSKKIAALKGDRIGILLPSSILAQILVFACQMAGKTPVMINWTVGGKHLDTVVDVSHLEVVLSSWTFLDALDNVDISRIEPLLYVLEELKVEISLLDILKGSVKALLSSKTLLKELPLKTEEDEAVVLFTSGTESMPKGVPLTSQNILYDLRASLEKVALYHDDRLLSILPPFHSFGFTVTGVMPLLCGLRVAFYPNPTDYKRLLKAIDRFQTNVLCSAPTFLKNILQQAQGAQGEIVRLIISGAEKASVELLANVRRACPKALFVEGYGITECAPVLCANVSGDRKNGVGPPLDGVKISIVDPEKLDVLLKTDEVGLILADGPNIFAGYLNRDVRDPFHLVGNTRWYVTGDLGKLDREGNLILAGRLKRFVKIGGEMVGLVAIEEALSNFKNSKEPQFVVLAEGDVLSRVQLVLFTTHDLEPTQVNQMLRKSGFSNLVKIDRVVHVDAIPVSATGKISFRELEKKLQPRKSP